MRPGLVGAEVAVEVEPPPSLEPLEPLEPSEVEEPDVDGVEFVPEEVPAPEDPVESVGVLGPPPITEVVVVAPVGGGVLDPAEVVVPDPPPSEPPPVVAVETLPDEPSPPEPLPEDPPLEAVEIGVTEPWIGPTADPVEGFEAPEVGSPPPCAQLPGPGPVPSREPLVGGALEFEEEVGPDAGWVALDGGAWLGWLAAVWLLDAWLLEGCVDDGGDDGWVGGEAETGVLTAVGGGLALGGALAGWVDDPVCVAWIAADPAEMCRTAW